MPGGLKSELPKGATNRTQFLSYKSFHNGDFFMRGLPTGWEPAVIHIESDKTQFYLINKHI